MVHDQPAPDSPEPAPSSPRPGLRFLAPLVIVTASGPVSMQMILPALPAIGEHFSVGPAMTHMLVSLALIAFGSSMLVWGPLSDRYGRRLPLVGGTVLFAAGAGLCLVAPTIELLIAGRVLGAAGAAAGMVLTRAMVRDIYPSEQVSSAMSQLTAGQIVPPMLAPALGGWLTDRFGWHWNFVVLVVLGLLALVLAWRLPETNRMRAQGAASAGLLSSFSHLLRLPRFNSYALFGAAAMAAYFAFLAGAPDVAMEQMHMTPSGYGVAYIALSLSFLVGNMLSARLSPRLGMDRMILLGGGLTVASALAGVLVLLGISVAAGSPWLLFVTGSVIAFGNGMSLNNAQAGAMGVEPRMAGAAAGIAGFVQMVSGALATQSLGIIHNGTPYPLFLMMAAACVLSLAIFVGCQHLARRAA
ncbi:multidrug effflux MFS transporter [Insolitispirillum peregrinum]